MYLTGNRDGAGGAGWHIKPQVSYQLRKINNAIGLSKYALDSIKQGQIVMNKEIVYHYNISDGRK
jgi:hypothetical protein